VLTIFILGTCITNAPRAGSFRGAWNYFALVIGANGDGSFIFLLVNSNNLVEVDRKELVLVQRHI